MDEVSKTIINVDERGGLGVINLDTIPFVPKRFFWIFNTPLDTPRAGHGHTRCEQYLMAQGGEINIRVTPPSLEVHNFKLLPGDCYHLKTHHWLELQNFTEGAVLGVWASEAYDRSEYIETFDDFLEFSNGKS